MFILNQVRGDGWVYLSWWIVFKENGWGKAGGGLGGFRLLTCLPTYSSYWTEHLQCKSCTFSLLHSCEFAHLQVCSFAHSAQFLHILHNHILNIRRRWRGVCTSTKKVVTRVARWWQKLHTRKHWLRACDRNYLLPYCVCETISIKNFWWWHYTHVCDNLARKRVRTHICACDYLGHSYTGTVNFIHNTLNPKGHFWTHVFFRGNESTKNEKQLSNRASKLKF